MSGRPNQLTTRWPAVRARFLFREVNERGHDLPLASVTRDGGVEFRADLDISVWNPGDDVSSYKRVQPGDFVIGLRSFQSGIGSSALEGLVSPAYTVLRPSADDIEQGYFRHLFKSDIFVSRLANVAQGIRQGRTIATEDFYGIRLPVPPRREQRAIADFLDTETARIDALITKKRRLVSALVERDLARVRDMLVGVASSGPRKAAVDWLGEVPADWPVTSVGSQFEVVLGRMLDPARAAGADQRPYVRNINVRWDVVDMSDTATMSFTPADQSRLRLAVGDVLVNEGGAGIGRTAIWNGELGECYFQKSVLRLRPIAWTRPQWFVECMRLAVHMDVFLVEGNLATIPHVPAERLRAHRFPFPPAETQDLLLGGLHQRRATDEKAQAALARQVDLLVEHRQALITAAVTGELPVGVAA